MLEHVGLLTSMIIHKGIEEKSQPDFDFGLRQESEFMNILPICRYYDLFLQNYLLLAKDKGWKSPLLGGLSS